MPDELAPQGVGMADHFLSGHAFVLRGGGAAFGGFIKDFLIGRADALHAGKQNREQIMQQGHEVGLHERRNIAAPPQALPHLSLF